MNKDNAPPDQPCHKNEILCPKCGKDIAYYLAKYMKVLSPGTKMGGILCPHGDCMSSYSIANTIPPSPEESQIKVVRSLQCTCKGFYKPVTCPLHGSNPKRG